MSEHEHVRTAIVRWLKERANSRHRHAVELSDKGVDRELVDYSLAASIALSSAAEDLERLPTDSSELYPN